MLKKEHLEVCDVCRHWNIKVQETNVVFDNCCQMEYSED